MYRATTLYDWRPLCPILLGKIIRYVMKCCFAFLVSVVSKSCIPYFDNIRTLTYNCVNVITTFRSVFMFDCYLPYYIYIGLSYYLVVVHNEN